MVKLLPLMAHLSEFQDEQLDLAKLAKVVGELWSNETFEGEILPFVLGMETEQDRSYLNKHLGLMETFEVFARAAGFILSGGKSDEVEAAVKK